MYGKLGHGDERGATTPRKIESLATSRVVEVACGSRHTVCLDDTGKVWTWGDTENGVCGHGADIDGHLMSPKQVSDLPPGVSMIAACGFHTLCIAAGRVYAWGEGKFGRLGLGDEQNRFAPCCIPSLARTHSIKYVAAGGFHSAAISDSGLLFTFGGGEHGQLGTDNNLNSSVPLLVESLKNEILLSAALGWSHSVALSDSGKVFTWGNSDHGKLGLARETKKVSFPRVVETLSEKRVIKIASYNEHTVALATSDSAYSASTSSFMGDLQKLLNNSESFFYDVTFVVEGIPVYAHKAILAVRSEHFFNMFSSQMVESYVKEIVIEDIRIDVFKAMMEYFYTDRINVTPEIAVHLYVVADRYVVERLKELCAVFVQRSLSVENVCSLLTAADSQSAMSLRDLCLTFVARNFDAVSLTDSFASLSKKLILEVVKQRR